MLNFAVFLALPLPETVRFDFPKYARADANWRKNIKIVHIPLKHLSSSRMGIFKPGVTTEALNKFSKNTLAELLGIEFTTIGEDFLEAKMPVDHRTHQPFGLLHGGASVALAETLGSVAAVLCIDESRQMCVGLDINANHVRGVKSGTVKGTTKPLHIGKKTHVWEIRIVNEQNDLVCVSRITIAILDKKMEG